MDKLVCMFSILGTLWMFLSVLALLRFPDTFLRLQSSTKGVTLGALFWTLAYTLHFESLGSLLFGIGMVAFYAITAPVGSLAMARAAKELGLRPKLGPPSQDPAPDGPQGRSG